MKTFQDFKNWLFPTLLSALCLMIWYDIQSVKTDIKMLIVESSTNKVKIEELEKRMDRGENKRTTGNLPYPLPNSSNREFNSVVCLPVRQEDIMKISVSKYKKTLIIP